LRIPLDFDVSRVMYFPEFPNKMEDVPACSDPELPPECSKKALSLFGFGFGGAVGRENIHRLQNCCASLVNDVEDRCFCEVARIAKAKGFLTKFNNVPVLDDSSCDKLRVKAKSSCTA
jgi:hypothetical protein